MTYHIIHHRLGWAFVRQQGSAYAVHRREATGWRCVLVTQDRSHAVRERDRL